jgi:peptidoglycan/LPS O-acetylase OafA/YrhL
LVPGNPFSGSISLSVFVKNLLLVPGLPLGSMRPVWSLMFEWWIYIWFGGVVFLLRSRPWALVAVAAGAYYTLFVNGRGEAGHLELIWAAGAASALYFPAIAAMHFSKLRVAVCFFVLAAAMYAVALDAYNLVAASLFSAGLLFLAMYRNTCVPSGPGIAATYRFLAGYSFTLFLIHYTVLHWVWLSGLHGLRGFLLAVVLANLVALVMAWFTERHHKSVARWISSLLLPRVLPYERTG